MTICRHTSVDGPPGWEEKFIINEDETPWWEISNPEERYKVYKRQSMRMWHKLHPGAAYKAVMKWRERHPGANTEAVRKWREEHPGVSNEVVKQHRLKHPEASTETLNRYYKTPKGKANRAKKLAKRRERSTNPGLYAARVEMLHIIREPCASCHVPYNITHQIDHILALCLGGTDDWDNLQPLCVLCHREKTEEDMRRLTKASSLSSGAL